MRTILDGDLAGNAERVGRFMLARLRAIAERLPIVGDVRGRGLLIGVDLVKDKATKEPLDKRFTRLLFERCLQRGLIVMAYNPEVRINPPLVIDEETAEEGIAILEESLGDVAAAVAGQAP